MTSWEVARPICVRNRSSNSPSAAERTSCGLRSNSTSSAPKKWQFRPIVPSRYVAKNPWIDRCSKICCRSLGGSVRSPSTQNSSKSGSAVSNAQTFSHAGSDAFRMRYPVIRRPARNPVRSLTIPSPLHATFQYRVQCPRPTSYRSLASDLIALTAIDQSQTL